MERFLGKTPSKRTMQADAVPAQIIAASADPVAEAVAGPAILSGSSPEDTKRLRADRAESIRQLSPGDFEKEKDALLLELKTLKGVEPGWCNEAAGVIRTKSIKQGIKISVLLHGLM